MAPAIRTCLFLLPVILFVNANNNYDCSRTKELSFSQTTSGDQRTFTFDLHRVSFVSEISIKPCSMDRSLADGHFNVTFVDPTDFTAQERVFSEEVTGRYNDNGRHFTISLIPAIYAVKLSFSHQHAITCSDILLIGCNHHVCQQEFCKNGGTCVGYGQCACPEGFMDPTCNSSIQSMSFDDYGFVVDTSGTLYTEAAAFSITGNTSITYGDDANVDSDGVGSQRNLRSLGHSRTFAHFFGNGGSLNLLPALMSGFHHGHHAHPLSYNSHSALHNFANGFSHTVQAIFGHGHHHSNTHYFYTTHGTSHYTYGSSLHYTQHHFHMHVHFSNNNGHHNHFHLHAAFTPKPGVKYSIVSSFSPHFGVSLYVNGHKLASLRLPSLVPSTLFNHGLPHPLCFGRCGAHVGLGPFNIAIGNIAVAGASVATLAANSLLGMLGLPMLNLLGASHHGGHSHTSKLPVHSQTTTSKGGFTLAPTSTTSKGGFTLAPTSTATKGGFTLAPTTVALATATTGIMGTSTQAFGPLCFACANLKSGGICSTTTQCYAGEVCAVYSGSQGDTHRCMSKSLCDAQKKTASGCWKCCTTDLCNDRCATVPVTTTTPCYDRSRCSLLKAIGYNICNDPLASTMLCPKSCNKCAASG